eukprot:TRINITY_DN8046_c0_g1_i1.p1 TRINITY_DN8046_c0_g1~~TRINITY_DN8046_c0_g1_i1.p1  ORF type:complete len:375 (-),score=56.52 TRINITY_DN8046_c0_g1_i1:9-1133(-)
MEESSSISLNISDISSLDVTSSDDDLNLTQNDTPKEEEEKHAAFDKGTLEDQATVITQIMVPVCITMVIVIFVVNSISTAFQNTFSSTLAYQESATDDSGTRILGSLLNAGIFVVAIVVVTVIFVILYKYRCMKILFGWLILSTCLMLGVFGGYLLYLVTHSLGVELDWITYIFLVWNFAAVGVVSVFWHAPMKVNQGYMIAISVILAVFFTRLPEWTTWAILAAIAIYDLFAVLCPGGPLRVLVETAQQRDEPIPALLYNASIVMMMADNDEHSTMDSDDAQPKGRGVKLGLGDFVFYSVLVGRAALYDMLTVFTSFIGIITGLFLTILLLAFWKKALPALPISIFLGLIFYLVTSLCLLPMVSDAVLSGLVL